MGRGRRATVASPLGIETGAVIHVLAAVLGSSAVLARWLLKGEGTPPSRQADLRRPRETT